MFYVRSRTSEAENEGKDEDNPSQLTGAYQEGLDEVKAALENAEERAKRAERLSKTSSESLEKVMERLRRAEERAAKAEGQLTLHMSKREKRK